MNETSRTPIDLSDTGLCDEELFSRIPQDTLSVEKITAPRYSYWRSVGRVFFHKKINIVVLACLALILVFTYIYPSFSGYDKYQNIMFKISETHYAKTWLLDPRAPKIEKPAIICDISTTLKKAFNI